MALSISSPVISGSIVKHGRSAQDLPLEGGEVRRPLPLFYVFLRLLRIKVH